ncbi:MAG TPA: DUF4142 domain-containing protein [Polyangiaceae bacterium]|nr:DUF4142 domain-containing protein [Polyangiaceae bacterium]
MFAKTAIRTSVLLAMGLAASCSNDEDASSVVQWGGGGSGAVAGASAGGRSGAGNSQGGNAGASEGGSSTSPSNLSDAQVFGVLDTANAGEIEQGNLALEQASNADVQAFAQQMVTDHTAARAEARALAEAQSTSIQESSVSRGLQQKAASKTAELSALSGAAFDSAYISVQIEMHTETLLLIDQALTLTTDNEELNSLLEKLRPKVQAHLDHAQSIAVGL